MKAWKVIRNILLAVAGLVLALLVTLQILLRPSVLTGIVNDVAADFVDGDVSFREVRAHVIKSFPYLNIDATDFSITYPHERYARYDTLSPLSGNRRFNMLRMGYGKSADSTGRELTDTLASFRQMTLSVNYMALLGNRTVHVHKLELLRPRIFAHYFDSTSANWDILPLGGEKDTTKKSKPLPEIVLDEILLTDRPIIIFTNPQDTLFGMFTMRRLALDGKLNSRDLEHTRSSLTIDSLLVSGRLPADTVAVRLDRLRGTAKERQFTLEADARATLRTGSFGRVRLPIHLDTELTLPEREDGSLEVILNRLNLSLSALELSGKANILKRLDGLWDLDVNARVQDCPLNQLAQEFKDNIPLFQKVSTNALLSLSARAKGSYGKGQVPSVNAEVQIPRSWLAYEGLGRRGTLALDALVTTDDLKEINCQVEKLFVDIVGAQLDASASVKDVLGEDPAIRLDGRLTARIDSLTQAYTRESGITGTGLVKAVVKGSARLSQLNMAKIGNASITADLNATDVDIQDSEDSLSAQIPSLLMGLETKGNTLDKTLRKGTRVLALKADIDTLNLGYKDMYIRGSNVLLRAQNSAEILKGSKDMTPLMGILKVGSLRLRDADGMGVILADNRETFRIEPATSLRPSPRLSLTSDSKRLGAMMDQNRVRLQNFRFDLSATRHVRRTPNTDRRNHLLDSLQRVYPGVPRDSLFRHSRLNRQLRDRQREWADKDVNISISGALKEYVRNWNIEGNVVLDSGRIQLPDFPLKTTVSAVKGRFDTDTLRLENITLQAGQSDLTAQARLTGLRRSLLGSSRNLLKLKADVRSNFLDANELLGAYAQYSARRPAADAPDSLKQSADTLGKLLVIPSNLDVAFSLEAAGIRYDSLDVSWAAADIAMRQRTLQVTNALAATNMGDMYFEGFYRTRSKEDIKAGFDLNLVNITAEKVITLFPSVDTLMPLLTTFQGDLDCELAVTTDLDTLMQVVLPSMDGTLNISGKDLGLQESKQLTKIANMLMFKNRKEARVDNMAVSGIVHDNVLEIFPFVMGVDRYLLAASGTQHLKENFLYHVSVLKSPLLIKFGLNAWGDDFDNVHYKLARPKYVNANVPVYTQQLDAVKFNLVAAIHNIFEVGIEKALDRNRNAASSVSALSETEIPAEVPAESEVPRADGLAGLIEQVNQSVSARRETLKQEVVTLQKEIPEHEQ